MKKIASSQDETPTKKMLYVKYWKISCNNLFSYIKEIIIKRYIYKG